VQDWAKSGPLRPFVWPAEALCLAREVVFTEEYPYILFKCKHCLSEKVAQRAENFFKKGRGRKELPTPALVY